MTPKPTSASSSAPAPTPPTSNAWKKSPNTTAHPQPARWSSTLNGEHTTNLQFYPSPHTIWHSTVRVRHRKCRFSKRWLVACIWAKSLDMWFWIWLVPGSCLRDGVRRSWGRGICLKLPICRELNGNFTPPFPYPVYFHTDRVWVWVWVVIIRWNCRILKPCWRISLPSHQQPSPTVG